jgi:hypothetical protein
MRRLLLLSSSALVLVIIVQFYLAAFGAFGDRHDTAGFTAHEWMARTALPVLAVLVVVAASGARLGRSVVVVSTVPLIAMVLQVLLFLVARAAGSDTHPGGASLAGAVVLGFHALFGLAALVAAAKLQHSAWQARTRVLAPTG